MKTAAEVYSALVKLTFATKEIEATVKANNPTNKDLINAISGAILMLEQAQRNVTKF